MTPEVSAPAKDEPLEGLGSCLLTLVELAQRADTQNFLRDSVAAFNRSVEFESAWWGELSRGAAGEAPRIWMHGSVGLESTFADEWNKIASVDPFGALSMSNLGTVVHFDSSVDEPPAVGEAVEFGRRHRLSYGMAITIELPQSGLYFFISLYRSEGAVGFDQQERIQLKWFTKHLVQHWRHHLASLRNSGPSWDSYALADGQGVLLYLGRRVGTVLDALYPGWSGMRLPANLVGGLGDRRILWSGNSERLVQEPCGNMVALSLRSRENDAGLPPRELSVAALYAQGRSSKEIAMLVGLTPATVRTYLSRAYRQLGVQNKFELMMALKSRNSLP